MKLPIISGKEVIKTLTKEGFQIKGRKVSHVTLEKTNHETYRTTVPLHRELGKGLLIDIIRQSGYTREQFLELL